MLHFYLRNVARDISLIFKCYGCLYFYSYKAKKFVTGFSPAHFKKYQRFSRCLFFQIFLMLLNMILTMKEKNTGQSIQTVERILPVGFILMYLGMAVTRKHCSYMDKTKERVNILNALIKFEHDNFKGKSKSNLRKISLITIC